MLIKTIIKKMVNNRDRVDSKEASAYFVFPLALGLKYSDGIGKSVLRGGEISSKIGCISDLIVYEPAWHFGETSSGIEVFGRIRYKLDVYRFDGGMIKSFKIVFEYDGLGYNYSWEYRPPIMDEESEWWSVDGIKINREDMRQRTIEKAEIFYNLLKTLGNDLNRTIDSIKESRELYAKAASKFIVEYIQV